jgi:hypothetical protein
MQRWSSLRPDTRLDLSAVRQKAAKEESTTVFVRKCVVVVIDLFSPLY